MKFLSALTDEEVYSAFVKLPFMINELSCPGTVYNNSLNYVYSRIGTAIRRPQTQIKGRKSVGPRQS
jgi:hypothetical protein